MKGLYLRKVVVERRGLPLIALDIGIGPGEVVTLMGPSGSGKSTLLRFVVGALPEAFEARGSVELDGRILDQLPPERRHLGLLFQDDLLFPHLSVGGNLLFALPPGGSRGERRLMAEAALAEAGLDGFFSRDPATLSGGQRARVSLLRVLMSRPGALLLDEPFSKLDMDLRRQIRAFVFAEIRRRNLPALLVTHDPQDAHAAAGRVVQIGAQATA